MANGCYDLIHNGHLRLIKHAKTLGNTLILAVDSDRRVAELKGSMRPINKAMDRKEFLECIKGVALVVEFDTEQELEKWIKKLDVDILVVGSEYRGRKVVGGDLVKEVVYFDRIPGYSSTSIIEGNNY